MLKNEKTVVHIHEKYFTRGYERRLTDKLHKITALTRNVHVHCIFYLLFILFEIRQSLLISGVSVNEVEDL